MNIPIQETAGEIEKVEKEEELTLESLKKERKPAEPPVDEEEEDCRASHFFTSACLTLRHSRH